MPTYACASSQPWQYSPLALAPADLVGVAGEQVVGQAHLPQRGPDLLHPLLPALPQPVDGHGLQQTVPDAHGGVQGGLRILEDDLHPPVVRPAPLPVQACDVLPLEADAPPGGLEDAGDHAGKGGLAASAPAAEQDALSIRNRQIDVVQAVMLLALVGKRHMLQFNHPNTPFQYSPTARYAAKQTPARRSAGPM